MIDPKLHEKVKAHTKDIVAISMMSALPIEERVDMIKAAAQQILKEYRETEAKPPVAGNPEAK